MKNMASWLITIFIVMFWVFRLVVSFIATIGIETAFAPADANMEIIILFISFFSILLIAKRKLIGGIIYLLTYGYYFGLDALKGITSAIDGTSSLDAYTNTFMSLIAIFLAVSIVIDLIVNKDRSEGTDNKDTHWFYKNSKYDRKLDERADKNQYKIN